MRAAGVAAALTAIFLLSCAGGGREPEPTVTAGATPAVSPQTETTPLAVAGRVRLYAADEGDNGAAVAGGDFNGDGHTDVLFAAAFADGPGNRRPDAGEAYLFLGPFQPDETRDAAAGEQDATVYGADDGDQTGRSAAAGDINGDGVDDIVLAAPFGDEPDGARQDAGEVHVVFGSPELGRQLRAVDLRDGADLSLYGATGGDLAGLAVTVADLNGDPAADLIVGALWADGPDDLREDSGEVYVLFGSPSRSGAVDVAAGEQDATVYGALPGDRLGESVAAGDVNGDGLADLLPSATFAPGSGGASAAGQTYVIYAPPPPLLDLSTGQPDVVIYGVDEGDQLGHVVAVGDVDADGAGDILLTAVSADGEQNRANLAGEAALVLGRSLPAAIDIAAGEGDALIYGADREDRLGRSATTGDVDGDGRADLLLAAPGAAGEGEASPQSGEIYVVAGPAAGVLRLPSGALTLAGDDAGDSLASAVYGRHPILALDVDADGADEIVVSAPTGDGPDERRRDCGEAYILFVGPR